MFSVSPIPSLQNVKTNIVDLTILIKLGKIDFNHNNPNSTHKIVKITFKMHIFYFSIISFIFSSIYFL